MPSLWTRSVSLPLSLLGQTAKSISLGYKYYGVYMPLVAIQWALAWKCRYSTLNVHCDSADLTARFLVMVETRGFTLGKPF